jgi:hypothetical protein
MKNFRSLLLHFFPTNYFFRDANFASHPATITVEAGGEREKSICVFKKNA